MQLINKKSLALIALFLPLSLWAQEKDSAEVKEKEEKKVKIVPLPIIGANPTTGFIAGFSPGFYYTMGDPSNTSMSDALAYILYTTNNQFYISLRATSFFSEDQYILMSDVRFAINSQPTYGLGTNPEYAFHTSPGDDENVNDNPYEKIPRREMLEFNHVRFYQTMFKRIQDTRLFVGLGYHLDHMYSIKDNVTDLDATPPVISFHEEYQNRIGVRKDSYTQSGISANFMHDSRDNVANPYDGWYALASLRAFPEFLGSTASQSQLWLEYRNYFTIDKDRPRNLLAFWSWGWFETGGDIPYLYLPATGWDMFGRSGRPYTLGRFRGEDIVYSELEWRFPLQKEQDKIGGVIFANVATASNRFENVGLYDFMQFGYGFGLRYTLSADKRINVALDYGWGINGASGVFLNLKEMF